MSEVDRENFYKSGKDYWQAIPATVDGVLNGLSHVSSADISGSRKFLMPFLKGTNAKITPHCALDCGAGIGRVTKWLLLPLFETVDMVDQNEEFLSQAKQYIGDNSERVERFICCGLQDFTPECDRYDLIWFQWVLGHLTNDDLIAFLLRCRNGLTESGLIVVKENVKGGSDIEFDETDSCYTRPRQMWVDLFTRANLVVVSEATQQKFPKDLYQVQMFALKRKMSQ